MLAMLAAASSLHAATRDISGSAGLAQALTKANSGDILLLAPGEYGPLKIGPRSNGLTLRSANPKRPAKFGRLNLTDAKDVVLDGLEFVYTFRKGDHRTVRPFSVAGAQNISVINNRFVGDLARNRGPKNNGFATGVGLQVRGSRNVRIEGNEFTTFDIGLMAFRSNGVTIRRNNIHSLRRDGMELHAVTKVLIEGNWIHDFKRSPKAGDHSDMIQFWTNKTKTATRDVTIRGNILNSGNGLYTQTIFMRNDMVDRGIAGDELFYRDILIEENVILNAHLHGITVGETDGLTIRRNSLIQNPVSADGDTRKQLWTPRITVAPKARRVRIENNVTSAIIPQKGRPGWTIKGNVRIQRNNRMKPGHYSQMFSGNWEKRPYDLKSYEILPGSAIDRDGVGASMLRNRRN